MPCNHRLTLRPYQTVCAICALGAPDGDSIDPDSAAIRETIRANPDQPMTLRCNAGDVFQFQDCGSDSDRPADAPAFNIKRDLDILHALNLPPGGTLTARMIMNRVLDRIETVAGICGYETVTAEVWRGCPRSNSGNYERGRASGIEALIPPRTADELNREKEASLAAMAQTRQVDVRPHILACAVCQYGGSVRPPFPDDNLPELIQRAMAEPDLEVRMAPQADWMMCAPCPSRAPALNACVNNLGGGGVSNQLRDLRVLQKTGLTYGDVVPIRDFYRRLFAAIAGTLDICKLDQARPSVWWTGCGSATTHNPNFDKGRERLQKAWTP